MSLQQNIISNSMIRAIVLSLFFTLISFCSFGQKVYSTDREYQADVKVYVTDQEYKADLVVYKTDKEYRVNKNDNKGIWYFTNRDYRADKKVYFVDREYQADLIVYFTDKEYRAGWKNRSKKYLMY